MKLGKQVGLGTGHIVLDRNPASPPPKGHMGTQPSPQKGGRAPPPKKKIRHVYCGQTAGWIKMALGMEVGLSPVDFVLDGDTAPSPKGGRASSPQFLAYFYCGQTTGSIKMLLGMEVASAQGTLC